MVFQTPNMGMHRVKQYKKWLSLMQYASMPENTAYMNKHCMYAHCLSDWTYMELQYTGGSHSLRHADLSHALGEWLTQEQ